MRAKEYDVLCMAVEYGVAYGIHRAYKHLDALEHPGEEDLKAAIENEVLNSICEWFTLDEERDGD